MAPGVPSSTLSVQARRTYVDGLQRELGATVHSIMQRVRELPNQAVSGEKAYAAREAALSVPLKAAQWQQQGLDGLMRALQAAQSETVSNRAPARGRPLELSLVADDTIELEIVSSRLALALMDKASWEFSDLRYRMAAIDRVDEMPPQDILRPHVLARQMVDGWLAAGLTLEHWHACQPILHEELSTLLQGAYHDLNGWLMQQGVCTEVNLRSFIRRSRDAGGARGPVAGATGGGFGGPAGGAGLGGGVRTGSTGALVGGQGPAGRPGGISSGQGSAADAAAIPVPPGGTVPHARFPTPVSAARQRMVPTPETAHLFAPTVPDPGLGLQRGVSTGHSGSMAGANSAGAGRSAMAASGPTTVPGRGGAGAPAASVDEETRLLTRFPGLMRSLEQAEAVLGRLNRLVSRQVPEFAGSTLVQPHSASPGLKAAITEAQLALKRRFGVGREMPAGAVGDGGALGPGGAAAGAPAGAVDTPGLLQELQARKQILKQAATTPVERATIEIVALMFQSLLTEERLPASIRVWFARLQMPVLRVAVVEPDFFATVDHPARKLIDRMGACVMGFEAGSAQGVSEALEKEVKRVVQVVEAYPDTGRRVFQTVLTEFEKFIENYFKTTHQAASKGVSLAQQIEQRETLAIQYTIELRKMLEGVPVHDGVREFMFHVWADVLATSGVKSGASSDTTRQMQRAAAELVWLAGAKVSREERADAIRRLPPLLKQLREGMSLAGVPLPRQDEYIQALNNALAAAFSARTATVAPERMAELKLQLETLEEVLPDLDSLEIDEDMIRDLSDQDSNDLEVVSDGGSMPTPAMLAWATELKVGSWFKLELHGRIDPVQLAWLGMRGHLSLFVSSQGRTIMFQKHRLASYLQAGLLVPAEEEALTVRATREALAKLDAQPERLLN